jgi:hypothetical protein
MAKIQISELVPTTLNVLNSQEMMCTIGGARRSLININDSFNTQLGINTAVIVQLGNGNLGWIGQFTYGGIS